MNTQTISKTNESQKEVGVRLTVAALLRRGVTAWKSANNVTRVVRFYVDGVDGRARRISGDVFSELNASARRKDCLLTQTSGDITRQYICLSV